ncbi:histidine phosphatase family protein [Sanguibacter antarcticus]|uniref:Putative phosphoglycerate mutase n=1 Tax=Sanguibacter antarcticus TaxID=372484 RepID=A0A2A9E1M9_9MICO|nr:histidine phosphatase family protein [Sanguibacter antarcticus]PFG32743.1 putative phosphoglycerate mutase [Sanguibacter antarcticus]
MSVGTVVFLRHGRTSYNAAGKLQGQVDIPLDEVGLWQAEHGASALARTCVPTRVVASDLSRAAVTAAHFAKATGAEVISDVRVRERSFGQWEGLSRDEISAGWPEQFSSWRRGMEPQGVEVETRAAVAQRMLGAVDDHGRDLGNDDTLVVVSHGAAVTLGITAMLGLDPDAWRGLSGLNNVHWSRLETSVAGSAPGWRLVGHNIGANFPLDHWNAGPDWNLEPTSS